MNRYLHAVLTIIAIELGWIAINHSGAQVSAQQAATPVIITGVELRSNQVLPVEVRGIVDIRAAQPIPIEANRPIEVRIPVTSSPVFAQ